MSRKNGLEGLARWAERDDWAEVFDEVFDRHFGDLLDAYDIDFEALDELIGADNADMLWAWALEDFATLPRAEDGLTVVDDYLKRRGWKEGPTNRRHLEALRDSIVGFYEVATVEPRRAAILVDLVGEGEPIRIDDPVLAGAFRAGDRFAGRVVEIAGRQRVVGSTLHFPADASEALVADFRALLDRYRQEVAASLAGRSGAAAGDDAAPDFDLDDELARVLGDLQAQDETGEAPDAGPEETPDAGTLDAETIDAETIDEMFSMVFAGAFFGGAWLGGVLEDTLGEPAGAGVNRDDEPLQFHTVRLPLAQRSATTRLRARLDDCVNLTPAPPDAWLWLGDPGTGRAPAADAAFALMHESGAEEMARIELKAGVLTLVTNSAARARLVQAIVTEAAGDLLGPAEVTLQTLDQYLEAHPEAARRLRANLAVAAVWG